MTILTIILVILSAIARAAGDVIQFRFDRSIFPDTDWTNPKVSWMRKYKSDLKTPRFPFSTTIFVWTTDLWHLLKMIELTAIQIAIAIHFPIVLVLVEPMTMPVWLRIGVDTLILNVITGIFFELFYARLLIKRNKS